MEIMGEPNKDFNEAIKYMRDAAQKRVDEAYKKGVNDGSLDVKIRTEGAYQKGFNDGKEYGLDEADMREAVSYQKGLSDAWEAAKKIGVLPSCGGIDGRAMMAVFGTVDISEVFNKFCPSEAIAKLKIYEEQKNNNEIKVGDEVESLYDDRTVIENTIPWVVTWIREGYNGKKSYYGIDAEGTLRNNDFVRKTGRRFGIDKILEEMKQK